ncbi:hypothetical protein AB0M22_02220 [Nocardia sp. NPDC051756]|uniref:hypothetical protein n=1 Tax=Nocardia sp. NPDC051756 TaxID=3154751 RepID=UPI0034450FD6
MTLTIPKRWRFGAAALLSLMVVVQGGQASADEPSGGVQKTKDAFCAKKSPGTAFYTAWEGVENLLPYEWSLKRSPQAMARDQLYGKPGLDDYAHSKMCGSDAERKRFSGVVGDYIVKGQGTLKNPCFQPKASALDKAAIDRLAAYNDEVQRLAKENCKQESGLRALDNTKNALYAKIVEQG